MTRVRLAALLAAISLGRVTAVHAHHSSGMFELTNAIWMRGTIVRFEPNQDDESLRIYVEEITRLLNRRCE